MTGAPSRPHNYGYAHRPNPTVRDEFERHYAFNKAYCRAGRHVPHRWRSTFSTIINERVVELIAAVTSAHHLMLAHQRDGVEAAYMPRRRQIAGEWAELLLGGLTPNSSLLAGKRRRRQSLWLGKPGLDFVRQRSALGTSIALPGSSWPANWPFNAIPCDPSWRHRQRAGTASHPWFPSHSGRHVASGAHICLRAAPRIGAFRSVIDGRWTRQVTAALGVR